MPRAFDQMPQVQETSVRVLMQKPGEEPVEVNLDEGYTPPDENTDTKSKENPNER